MDDLTAASGLAALGHEARLALFRLLVRAGERGLPVAEIGKRLDMPPSTLAHHLKSLVDAGLVSQEKIGRQVLNRADFRRMRRLLAYVDEECCAGFPDAPAPSEALALPMAANDPAFDGQPQ